MFLSIGAFNLKNTKIFDDLIKKGNEHSKLCIKEIKTQSCFVISRKRLLLKIKSLEEKFVESHHMLQLKKFIDLLKV